jgi:hypothetical protein
MQKIHRGLRSILILLFLLGFTLQPEAPVAAQTPERRTTIVMSYTQYEWWLLSWETNEILCTIVVDHEGLPTSDEVVKFCGSELAISWQNTPPCADLTSGDGDSSECAGMYLFLVSSQPAQREVVVDLPEAAVWLTLQGCTPAPPGNFCPSLPSLLLTGEEPLPNEQITSIDGTFNGVPFHCDSDTCALPLQVTPLVGLPLEFWANSSYGDSSQRFTAQIRVIETGVAAAPGGSGWYVDVLSSQWLGGQIAGCAQSWQSFLDWWTGPLAFNAGRSGAAGIWGSPLLPGGAFDRPGCGRRLGLPGSRSAAERLR